MRELRQRSGGAESPPGQVARPGLRPAAGAAEADVPFAVGSRVVSERWGQGTVQRYDDDQVTVLFDEHGYRELFVPLVVERGLLQPGSS